MASETLKPSVKERPILALSSEAIAANQQVVVLAESNAKLAERVGELECVIEKQREFLRSSELELSTLRESLIDYDQCCVCKKWRHVEDMLRPNDLITDELCCSETCCEGYKN